MGAAISPFGLTNRIPSTGEADGGAPPGRGVKPAGVGVVVGQQNGLRRPAGPDLGEQLIDEARDVGLGVWWVRAESGRATRGAGRRSRG